MTVDRRTRAATLGVLLFVFAAGVVVGFVLDRGPAEAAPGEEPRAEAERSHVRGEEGPRRVVIDRVDLTDEQRAMVDSVVEHYRARMSELSDEYQVRYRETIALTREAIREILDDEQRARYDSLLAQRRRGGHAPDSSGDGS